MSSMVFGVVVMIGSFLPLSWDITSVIYFLGGGVFSIGHDLYRQGKYHVKCI
jgi:hypothetical protein